MQRYTTVLFDWDGTLARTLDIWLASLRSALQKRGHFLTDTEIGANYDTFRQWFEAHGHGNAAQLIDEALHIAHGDIPEVVLYPDARLVLERLHTKGIRLGLVTTSRHRAVDPLLRKYELESLFTVIVCGDDVTALKPDPEPLLQAMARLEAVPAQTLMVGDSASDIQAAKSAGIDSILFYPPAHETFYVFQDLQLLQPTHTIHDLRAIVTLI
jgi:pyrophosphatase PpaX